MEYIFIQLLGSAGVDVAITGRHPDDHMDKRFHLCLCLELDISGGAPSDYTTVVSACLNTSACVSITSYNAIATSVSLTMHPDLRIFSGGNTKTGSGVASDRSSTRITSRRLLTMLSLPYCRVHLYSFVDEFGSMFYLYQTRGAYTGSMRDYESGSSVTSDFVGRKQRSSDNDDEGLPSYKAEAQLI